jgi:serpin B
MSTSTDILIRAGLVLVLGAILLVACTPNNTNSDPGAEVGTLIQSSVERADPQVADATLQQVGSAYNAFAFDFYQQARQSSSDNLIFSPYSISTAFAMVYAGARNTTEAEMAQGFHYDLPQDELHIALNRLSQDVTANAGEEGEFELSIANAVWAQKDYELNQPYLDVLAAQYGAGVRIEDFKNEAGRAAAVQNVNTWVSEATREKITSIVNERTFTENTRMVLANAIYFYADWLSPFKAEATRPMPFAANDGSTNDVDMMVQQLFAEYAEGEGWQAIALPYQGGRVRMVAIRPADGTFDDFEAGLTATQFDEITSALEQTEVVVFLPKFEYETTLDELPDLLKPLGVNQVFEEEIADLSGIEPKQELYVAKAIHKATITVDEEGTEAAAVTVIAMDGAGAAPPQEEPKVITLDHPFFYVIQDEVTGTVLFVGRVVKL